MGLFQADPALIDYIGAGRVRLLCTTDVEQPYMLHFGRAQPNPTIEEEP